MIVETMIAIKKESGATYQQISEKSGVPLSTVQKVLGGITRPRGNTLDALSSVMTEFISPGSPRTLGALSFQELLVNHGHEDLLTRIRSLKESLDMDYVMEASSNFNTASEAFPSQESLKAIELFKADDKNPGEYTSADYDKFPDNIRVELIDGFLYDMASPSYIHQTILSEMMFQLKNQIKTNKGKCKIYSAPADVQLFDDNKTIVQPDLFILCNKDMKGEVNRTHGAPDFVVEIISKSTRLKDMTLKLKLYLDAGVKEYWIVDPYKKYIIKYVFENEDQVNIHTFEDTIPLSIYDDQISVNFSEINQELIETFGSEYSDN